MAILTRALERRTAADVLTALDVDVLAWELRRRHRNDGAARGPYRTADRALLRRVRAGLGRVRDGRG